MWYNISPEEFLKLLENPTFVATLTLLAIWSLIWKGLALWRASQKGQKVWFVALLCVNTIGVLEILYLFLFSKNGCCCCAEKKEIPPSQNP